jgi:hypothetical protein
MRGANMKKLGAIALSACALLLASCMSLSQKIAIKGIDPSLPVSASSGLFLNGQAVGVGDYQELGQISLAKKVVVPLKQKLNEVDLSADLKAAVAEKGGNGVAKLKISIDDFSSPDFEWASFDRWVGLDLALTGGYVLAFMLANGGTATSSSSQDSSATGVVVATGGLCAAGLGLFGLSFYLENKGHATYTIGLNGVAVTIPQ